VVLQSDVTSREQMTQPSTLSWLDGADDEQNTMMLDITGGADVIRIGMLADTSRLRPESIQRVLVGIETIAKTLSKRETNVAELASIV
jgi:hypothetical protein